VRCYLVFSSLIDRFDTLGLLSWQSSDLPRVDPVGMQKLLFSHGAMQAKM
jgi:hypothetical protein